MANSFAEKEESQPSGDRLLAAAIELFSENWYGKVSVAEICRRAKLSNGLFYRYYRDKEAIFRRILELVIARIAESIAAVSGDCPEARLRSFADIIFNFSRDNQAIVKVFREGQYRLFEYEQRLKAVYEDGLQATLGFKPDLSTYLFALGGLRFAATRRAFHEIPVEFESLASILNRGLYAELRFDPDKVFSSSITPMPLEVLPDGRERMLREGKSLIGRQGYYETNIHEITTAAGLSTGAFYTHFQSKETFFEELIHRVGREVRRFITLNLGEGLNPLERELRGLWLFIVFLSLDRHCYGIVREAEFILPQAVRAYYGAFVKGYRQRMSWASELDETTAIEFLLGVAHYLGIEVIFDKSPESARNIIAELGDFYRHGLFGLRG
jgi:AcrR family transcriptional regulator